MTGVENCRWIESGGSFFMQLFCIAGKRLVIQNKNVNFFKMQLTESGRRAIMRLQQMEK